MKLAISVNKSNNDKQLQISLKEFKENMKRDEHLKNIEDLKHSVESFAEKYPMPGHDKI